MIQSVRRRLASTGSDESGSAIVEFVLLVGPLLIPLVYLIIAAFEVQRTAFAVAEGARQAGRSYVTGTSADNARDRALYAANLAVVDQGLPPLKHANLEVDPPNAPICRGGTVTITVKGSASLPFLPKDLATIAVSAKHKEVIDELQDLPC